MRNNDKKVNILIFPNFVLQNILSALSSGTFVGSALNNVACITAGHLGIAKRIRVRTRFKQTWSGRSGKENKLFPRPYISSTSGPHKFQGSIAKRVKLS